MQVFVPFQDPFECAKVLDSRRFNKQILECKQILKAIRGESTAWANHPCVLMYKDHADWLQTYLNVFECYKAYKDLFEDDYDEAMVHYFLAREWRAKAVECSPSFLTDSFINQHRRRLYTKLPQFYTMWVELGTSDENWYYVNGEWRIYINGRLIKVLEEV
jgi:hypothetical protein